MGLYNVTEQSVTKLAGDWNSAGVEKGDMLLVHSSISRTLRTLKDKGIEPSPAMILDSLLEAIGPEGTLLLPLFNFDFAKGVPFDMRSSKSAMGALTEAARLRDGTVRTGHPIYSFAVLGARRNLFAGLANTSGYAGDSPFGILKRENGRIASLDLSDQNSMTFYHHVEECEKVPYRYMKHFTGPYTTMEGDTATRTFSLYVRDLEKGVLTDVDPMGEMLWENGHYQGERPKQGHGMRTIKAQALFDVTADIIRSGKAQGLLYSLQQAA